MKILILHQHFKTPQMGGAIRSYYLAKALVDRDLEVTVVTGSNLPRYKKELFEGIEIHYLPVAYENAFGFFKRGISFLVYAWKSARLARTISGVSVCYAISTPLTVGLAAMRIKSRLKIPYIFEVGDLWPEAPIQMGFVKNSFLAKVLYQLEKKVYQEAEAIVALSEPIQEFVAKKISSKKIHIIPNFADCDFYSRDIKNSSTEAKYAVQGKFVVSYLGAVGIANGLDYLIDCASAARKANLPVHFILCGEGAQLDHLKARCAEIILTNITFIGLVNRDTVKEIMGITDAAFICYKSVPVLETGSPNKYFDALAASKLIIINFGGWINAEIEREGCGLFVNPQNPEDFVKKIKTFISEKEKLTQFQSSSRKLAEEKYDRKKLSAEFANIFLNR